jgi:hypothetical protein
LEFCGEKQSPLAGLNWFKYEIDDSVIPFASPGETGNIALRGKFHGAFRHLSAEKDV